MKVDGQCHCGSIQFEAEIDPQKVVICHCTDCQSLSGTAYRLVVFTEEDALTFTQGEPKIYVKTAASGNRRAQAFCANCGAGIYATSDGDGPKAYGLRGGALKQRHELTPVKQVWRSSALHWVDDLNGVPGVEHQS